MSGHLSTLVLHQLRYGELDADALASARAHIEACPRCAERLQAQIAERAAFVLRPVPEALRSPAQPQPPGWLRRWLPGGLLVAALALLVALGGTLRLGASEPDVVRFRGALPDVEVWIDAGDGPRLLRGTDRLAAGSRVQLKYDPQGASHVAFAGRDGAGLVEIYGSTSIPEGDGLLEAPFALALDGTPGDQELFVLTADHPLDEPTVRAALQGDLDGISVSRAVVPKE